MRAQNFVISRQQALATGLPKRSLDRWLTRRGPWQRLLPGVYSAVTGTMTDEQQDIAALLYGGPGSMLTGPTALRWHGLVSPGYEKVDILIPSDAKRQSSGFVRILRTNRMPAQVHRQGQIRYAPAARAVADAARSYPTFNDVRAVVSEAVQKGACTIAELVKELTDGPMANSANLRAALIEVSDGIRSVAEGDFRRLIIRGRLPRPVFNARLYTEDGAFIAMIDAWWKEAGVGADVDSIAYHLSAAAQERDANRHDRATSHGLLLLHFRPRRIKDDGAGVLSEIRAAIENGQRRPPLPIVTLTADQTWEDYVAARDNATVTSPRSRRLRTASVR